MERPGDIRIIIAAEAQSEATREQLARDEARRSVRVVAGTAIKEIRRDFLGAYHDNRLTRGIEVDDVSCQCEISTRSPKDALEDLPKVFLNTPKVSHSLSPSCNALPRSGSPFGPGGSLRHGLWKY